MKADAEPASPSASTLRAALLDYYGAPGKYQLTLRQPALLFASIRDLLQMAAGRGAAEGADGDRLRAAANFFIRAALLYPGADHYAVMGLAPGETSADLKERYRLLMRLIHPDFTQGRPADWPADAAMRVNRAYEALSSPVQRRQYDEQLASLRSQRPAAPAKAASFQGSRRSDERAPRIGKKTAWIVGLAFGIPAVLLLLPHQEPDQLVQRASPAASTQGAAAVVAAEAQSTPALVSSERLPHGAPAPVAGSVPAMPAPAAPAAASVPPAVAVVTPAPVPVVPTPAPAPAVAAIARPAAPAPMPAAASRVAAPLPVVVAQARPASAVVAQARPAPAAAPIAVAPVQRPAPTLAAVTVNAPRPLAVAIPEAARPAAVLVVDDPAPGPAPVAALPMPVATVAPSTLPAAKLANTLAAPAIPSPTLADAQPLLTQMLQVLETGSAEQLLRMLDGDARSKPGAQALSRQYEQLVKGGRPVRLSQVEFNGEAREGGVLLVTGRVRLHTGEPTIGSYGQRLLLRAEFAQRAGKVQLTGLSGSAD